jgi:hypothetical protein
MSDKIGGGGGGGGGRAPDGGGGGRAPGGGGGGGGGGCAPGGGAAGGGLARGFGLPESRGSFLIVLLFSSSVLVALRLKAAGVSDVSAASRSLPVASS